MQGRIALALARTPRAADVLHSRDVGCARRRLFEAVPDRAPRAHVLRLLLRPDDLADLGIRSDELGDLLERERIELLETTDRDIGRDGPMLVRHDVVVHLPA